MKQIKIVFFFIFAGLYCAGQNDDCLLRQYGPYPDDTNKVNLLYNKGFALRNSDVPAAIRYAKMCLVVAIKINNKHYLAKALNLTGVLKSETGLQTEALDDFKKALELRVQIKDTLSQAIILNNMGNVYSNASDNESALLCYERSLQIAKSTGDDRWVHGALFSIAELQTNLGMFKQAEGNLYTLISWAQTKNDYEILGMCYKNMSVCKLNMGDTASAEAYRMQTLDIAEITGDDILKADALCGLAEIYLQKKNYESSLKNLQEALLIAEKNKYNEGLMNSWKSMAQYYKETGAFKEALYYLSKHDSALAVVNMLPDKVSPDLWKEKNEKASPVMFRPFSLKENIFECVVLGALALLLVVVLLNRMHEQKE